MKTVCLLPALAGLLLVPKSPAISLDDVQPYTGSGTIRAALVIEWNAPEVFNHTSVPAPVANKTLVWGYRFNGSASGTQMFHAIVAANPGLYAVESLDPFMAPELTPSALIFMAAGQWASPMEPSPTWGMLLPTAF